MQFLRFRDAAVDDPGHHSQRPTLIEGVEPETAQRFQFPFLHGFQRDGQGKVQFLLLFEDHPLTPGEDAEDQPLRVFAVQRGQFEGSQRPVDLELRRNADGEDQVAGIVLHRGPEQHFHIHFVGGGNSGCVFFPGPVPP